MLVSGVDPARLFVLNVDRVDVVVSLLDCGETAVEIEVTEFDMVLIAVTTGLQGERVISVAITTAGARRLFMALPSSHSL